MRLFPTHPTVHVAVAGAGLIAVGAAARMAPVLAFGGAMLLAVAIGRAAAMASVAHLRREGFEMIWEAPTRVLRVASGGSVTLQAELRNRSGSAVRCVGLRAVASSMLDTTATPQTLELSPGGRARVLLAVQTHRVGRWGVHGLALEVRAKSFGGDGLFEVPLLFASPLGIEVLPHTLAGIGAMARGGRSRRAAETGRPAALPGEGDELRELRDHSPGDPFRRIAWKASAKRGRLLVREMERDERDIVWHVVEASVELLAGTPGSAPLDRVIEEVARRATRALRAGHRVGLVIVASRLRAWIPPAAGAGHSALIASALAGAASCVDADRSELDEAEVAQRVAEHARPLDPRGLADLAKGDLDALARRCDELVARAPFAPRTSFAHTEREQTLRHYLSAFGVESPPRVEGEHPKTETLLSQVLARLVTEKPRASSLHVWAMPPSIPQPSAKAVSMLRARRIEVRWTVPPLAAGLGDGTSPATPGRGQNLERSPNATIGAVVDDAVRVRALAMTARGERLLRRLGVHVVRYRAGERAA